jgi:hypothetical protein
MREGGVPHIIRKLSMRVTIFLNPTSILGLNKKLWPSKVLENPNFKSFRTPNLGVLKQNDIWMQPLWLIIGNTIKGKVVASPQVWAVVNLVHPCTKNAPIMH